jgi:hypothetical protein
LGLVVGLAVGTGARGPGHSHAGVRWGVGRPFGVGPGCVSLGRGHEGSRPSCGPPAQGSPREGMASSEPSSGPPADPLAGRSRVATPQTKSGPDRSPLELDAPACSAALPRQRDENAAISRVVLDGSVAAGSEAHDAGAVHGGGRDDVRHWGAACGTSDRGHWLFPSREAAVCSRR